MTPQPRSIGLRADHVDHPGGFASGRHRELRDAERPGFSLAQRRVEQVHAGRLDRDPYLTDSRHKVGNLLEHELLGAAEVVLPDRLHDRTVRLQVKLKSSTRC